MASAVVVVVLSMFRPGLFLDSSTFLVVVVPTDPPNDAVDVDPTVPFEYRNRVLVPVPLRTVDELGMIRAGDIPYP